MTERATHRRAVTTRVCVAALAVLLMGLACATPLRAHGDEVHAESPTPGVAAPPAGTATAAPGNNFELYVVDTSVNDPLEGGEKPLENARVTAVVRQGETSVVALTARASGTAGTYVTPVPELEPGDYVVTWKVEPPGEAPFTAEFPIVVTGHSPAAGTFPWRTVALYTGVLLAIVAAFFIGRAGGARSRLAGSKTAVVVVLLIAPALWMAPAWAHGDEVHAEASPKAGDTSGPQIGIGTPGVLTKTLDVGKYRVTMTIDVPAAARTGVIRLTEAQAATLGVKTIEITSGPFEQGLYVTGQVEVDPARSASLASRVSGRITAVFSNTGDRVVKGQTLATIESTEIAEAQGALTTAQSNVIVAEAAYAQTMTRVQVALRNLEQQRELAAAGAFSQAPLQAALRDQAEAGSALASARADVASARSQLAQWEADRATHFKALQRMRELYAIGVRSKAELEAQELEVRQDDAKVIEGRALVVQQRRKLEQAQMRVDVALQAVTRERALAGSGVLTRKELTQAQGALDTARAEAEQAAASANVARRAVETAQDRLQALGAAPGSGNRVSVTASLTGIVTEREAAAGEVASPDKTLFTIVDPRVVWVEGDVFERDLPFVRVGMRARIKAESLPGKEFVGRVSSISTQIDPTTRAYRVRVVIDNASGALRIGSFVRALLITESRRSVVVPAEAVQTRGGLKIVFVQVEGGYEPREVQVGETSAEKVEIREGLEAGDVVVTTGSYQLRSMAPAR